MEMVRTPPRPGAGAPEGEWTPQTGLVFATLARPEGKNPETEDDLEKMLAASPGPHGARYQPRISDGYNPFGPSDMYLSAYRGWLKIPAAGKYTFCSASNEASFSFLDGQPLIHWPGRHTAERGLRGEKNVELELTAGLHYVEYYHEEVFLEQVAFLGWKPPGAVAFDAIPEELFPQPHAARVVKYETPAGPAVRFEPEILDSIWPEIRHEGQYTRVAFAVADPQALPEGATFAWDFGDGQKGEGARVEHVYLALGQFPVALAATLPGGGTAGVSWSLEVYEIQHATDQLKEGRPGDYLALAKTYDRTKLDATALGEAG